MLFHASAENSEPTCTTARITSTFTSTIGPPTPTCTGCSELQPAFFQNSLQPAPKFAAQRRGVAPHREGQQNQRRQRQRLGRGEDVLDQRAQLHAEDVHDGQKDDDRDSGQVGRVDADLHVAQHHGPHPERGHVGDVPQPMGRRDGRERRRRETCRRPRRRRRWSPSESPETASSRREIPTAAPATRAGRRTVRRPWASWPPARRS